MTRVSVADPERLSRPGHLVVALPLSGDGIASLVRPGLRLDLIAADGVTLATDIPVVGPAAVGAEGLARSANARTALIEVPEEVAARLAASGGAGVTIAVR
ncbi:MAG: hypothetical protein IPL36_02070 [Nigerium sp.]|nr:hypothetical protein [Nigerium sp.]